MFDNKYRINFEYLNRFPDMNIRFVMTNDAEFIWELRNHDYKSRHLHAVGSTISEQKNWLLDYKQREKRGEEYYFVISDSQNERQGLFRIYNIRPDSATVGSWIFKEGAPNYMAIRAELMLKEVAFNDLDKKTLYFDTRKKNKRIYTYSILQYSEVIGEDDENYYFKLDRDLFRQGKEKVKKLMEIDC